MRNVADSEYLDLYETTSVEDADAKIRAGWVLVSMTTANVDGAQRRRFQLRKPVHPALIPNTAGPRSRSAFRNFPV